MHFQAFLLEGMARWNDQLMTAAVRSAPTESCYDDKLKAAHSHLVEKLYGQPASHQPALKYTGELFGIEYLYRQTGQSLNLVKTDTDSESDDDEDWVEDADDDEGFVETEDLTIPVEFSHDVEVVSSRAEADEVCSSLEQPVEPASESDNESTQSVSALLTLVIF